MAGWIWGLVGILVLGIAIAIAVVRVSSGAMVFASYPGTFEFTGIQRFSGADYFGLKWVPNASEVGPCPVVIHLPDCDVGAAEWAEPKRLLQRGWVEVPFLPLAPEWVVAVGPDVDRGLPTVAKYGYGDLRVATQHTDGVLTSVWVVVVAPDEERIAQGLPPGHEHMATSVGAARFAISVGGRRITLPISQAQMIQALGPPASQRKDY